MPKHIQRGPYFPLKNGKSKKPEREVTREERLRWAEWEVARLSALARAHPDDTTYRLAAERVQREEVDAIRRLIEQHKPKRRSG